MDDIDEDRFKHVPRDGVLAVVEDIGYRAYDVYLFFDNGVAVCIQVANGGRNCYLCELYPEEFNEIRASSSQLLESTQLLKFVTQTALNWYYLNTR